jgi:hypothetical protein
MKAPIEMPADLYTSHEFELQRVDYSAPEASGRMGGVQAGFPLWLAVYTLDGGLDVDESDQARAFMAQIRGATRRFVGRDIGRPYPKAHKSGFAGMTRPDASLFDGSATAWSEAITADNDSQVTLQGIPAGLELGLGDYIGFRWVATESSVAGLTWHACVRVVEGGTAAGTGELTVTSEPPIPAAVPAGAVAYLNEPACIMTLVTDQSKLQPINFRLAIGGGQFVGAQDIRA